MATKAERAEALRKRAVELEQQARLEERLADAATIPTCQECGSRVFKVYAYTVVAQSISYEEDEENGDWCDDYESGDHTNESESATCAECGADAKDVLRQHGWVFYDPPTPEKKQQHTESCDLDEDCTCGA